MKKNKIAIIGYGMVGKAQEKLVGQDSCIIHDPVLGFDNQEKVNTECSISFICVPTPMNADGSCDTSIVEGSIKWIKTPLIVIRSTIIPGTTEYLVKKYNKQIVFQPEYLGETAHHPYQDMQRKNFIILGGEKKSYQKVCDFLKQYVPAETRFFFTDARTAELCKYMENAFLATKVIFCNEFYEIAEKLEVDYNELRELWLADSRIGRSHSLVYPQNRGFGGKCLPKDVNALFAKMKSEGFESKLIKTLLDINKVFRKGRKD